MYITTGTPVFSSAPNSASANAICLFAVCSLHVTVDKNLDVCL